MRFIDKDNLISDLKTFNHIIDDAGNSVELNEDVLNAVVSYIENFKEDDCIKCGVDYWLRYYDIFTREWVPSDGEEADIPQESIFSFIISRKDNV